VLLKLGIITPVLSLFPGVHGAWEQDASIDDVRIVAQAAERLGYDFLTCSEHIAIPADAVARSGARYWDPLATFGYLAGHTSRIRFATVVLVLPYHHPLEIAKRYGTLDRVCGGRLVLGVGAGYLEPEFAALGVPFAGRNERTDDAIRALRVAFGRPQPAYDGPCYQFSGLTIDPCGVQENIPLWVGGRTRRSLRRAVELGDGWCPFAVSGEQVGTWLKEAATTDAWRRRTQPLEVVLGTRVDPLGAPGAAAAAAEELRRAGATALSLRFVHESRQQYTEQLEAMREVAARL
jgi:probable F420-dependent oxidoreductase